jgi:RNA polymerase sigma-70 factor (ECF subfamily)
MSIFGQTIYREGVLQATFISDDQKCAPDLEPYLNGLYGYAVVLSRNKVDAEDLVQETCVRAVGAIHRLRSDTNMKAWLFTILRNTWFNQCRRSPAVLSVISLGEEVEIGADSRADLHNQYIVSEERTRVQNAIQKLPTNLREIILLRVYEELSYQEISEVLCCPTGTVMSRLSRARSKLRELLSK